METLMTCFVGDILRVKGGTPPTLSDETMALFEKLNAPQPVEPAKDAKP